MSFSISVQLDVLCGGFLRVFFLPAASALTAGEGDGGIDLRAQGAYLGGNYGGAPTGSPEGRHAFLNDTGRHGALKGCLKSE